MESEQFFEIKVMPSEVQVRIHPPEGGKRANLTDVQKKLGELQVDYRMEHLFDIYRRASNEFETLAKRESTKYELNLEISEGGYEAHMTVIPPQRGNDQMTPAKVKEALEAAGVEKGIQYDQIKRILADHVEGERVLVAEGKRPEHGVDGWIEFNKEHETPSDGAVEDNRADYREMNLIQSVEEGYLIAKVFPPTRGVDGYNVKGKRIKGDHGKRAKIRLGANAVIKEEGNEIHAAKAGFVVFSGEKISVEDVLQVPNVDSETGNIHFSGVVRVLGQVEDGFAVEGTQGIQVLGTVGSAALKSRGDIHVSGGMFGAKVRSSKSVHAKFISESEVEAGTHVIADDYILHSTVQAGQVVMVTKPMDGFITGGLVRAGRSVWAPSLGSEASGEKTRIEVGVEFNLRADFDTLQEQIGKNRENFDRLRKNIRVLQAHKEAKRELPEENEQKLRKMLAAAWKLRGLLLEGAVEFHRLDAALNNSAQGEGFVFASNRAYPGTNIQIKRHHHIVNSTLESCAFRVLQDELKVQDFGEAQRHYKSQYGKLPA